MTSLSSSERTERLQVFMLSMLLGAFLFVLIYGPYVLNPFYDDWIFMTGERDMPQHYIGFCMYRSSPWQFPIGLVTTASAPHHMSVIYTDAIPLFAFIGKLLNPLLPQVFQYLGIYGLLSMALTGGLGALTVYEYTSKKSTAVISSVFFSMSWILIYRMFYHTSLTSHWLILLAFYLWTRLDLKAHIAKNCMLFFLFSAVAMLIHPYLWAMCGGIIAICLLEFFLSVKDIKKALLYALSFCMAGAACLYAFGAFTGGTKASLGAGSYEANLNTFFNSMGYGLLPGFSVALLQYEGFGYLGAGVLLLLLTALLVAFAKKLRPEMNLHRWMMMTAALCFIIFSIIPEISFGEHILADIPLGRVGRTVVGIFRSNGRFIWPVCYMLITAAIVFLSRHVSAGRMIILTLVCLAFQTADMMPYLIDEHEKFAVGDYEYAGILDGNTAIDEAIGRYDHIVMDIKDGEVDQYLTYYAYLHGMTTNDFYYARPIESKVQNTLEALRNDMAQGRYDDSLLYIIGRDQLPLYRDFDLSFYEVKGRYIASHEPIEGLTGIDSPH
ncbi:MAG: hypothetical protein J5966_10160 [Lachnospiraceae bacterium]|nr:hypothetical protein [Lachnospiraceae bacterium]